MKHLNYLRESNDYTLSYDESEELKNFCELNLSYLIDDGYNIDISEITYDRSKGDKNTYILFYKRFSDTRRNGTCREFYLNDEVKDSLIPFIEILSNSYNIGSKVICQLWGKYKITDDKLCTLAELDTERLGSLRSIWIKIDSLKELNESQKMSKMQILQQKTKNKTEELKEFCNSYLAYLLDDHQLEFHNYFSYYVRGTYTQIKLTCKGNNYISWSETKDDIISFFEMLISNYDIIKTNTYISKNSVDWQDEDTLDNTATFGIAHMEVDRKWVNIKPLYICEHRHFTLENMINAESMALTDIIINVKLDLN